MDNQNNLIDENLEKDILLTVEEELSRLKQKKPKTNHFKSLIPKKISRAELVKRFNKRTVLNVSIVTITCIITVSIAAYFFPNQKSTNITKNQPIFTTTKLTTGNPKYETTLPAGKTIGSLGGWKRISPESADPVYAYSDKINNISIAVSQQPLPENFKENTTAQIEKMATSFNAMDKVTVGGNHIYIGTSGDGPQSVIFTKKDLLILIKSTSRISDNDWVKYITSLE